MFPFRKYKGEVFKTLPIDFGKKILKLNWVISSHMIDEYIYQNDKGDLFHVHGVWQIEDCETGWGDEDTGEDYSNSPYHIQCSDGRYSTQFHMAIVIPIKSKEHLVKYLKGEIACRKMFNLSNSYSYLLKLTAPTYFDDRGQKHFSMHPVKDNKEVTRYKELELSEFGFIEGKKCPTKSLSSVLAFPHYAYWKYNHRKKLNFVFIDEDEKIEIDKFIGRRTPKKKQVENNG